MKAYALVLREDLVFDQFGDLICCKTQKGLTEFMEYQMLIDNGAEIQEVTLKF